MGTVTFDLGTIGWGHLKQTTVENATYLLTSTLAMGIIGMYLQPIAPPLSRFLGIVILSEAFYLALPILSQIDEIRHIVMQQIKEQFNPSKLIREFIIDGIWVKLRDDPQLQPFYDHLAEKMRVYAAVARAPIEYVQAWVDHLPSLEPHSAPTIKSEG